MQNQLLDTRSWVSEEALDDASSNAEAIYASNEHAMLTQLIGILAIEKQTLKLLECENPWIQHDITEQQQLKLYHLSKQQEIDFDSGEWKALHTLTRCSFETFQKKMRGLCYYMKLPFQMQTSLRGTIFVAEMVIQVHRFSQHLVRIVC